MGEVAKWIETEATVSLEKSPDGFAITGVHLDVSASVPGSEPEQFQAAAQKAKAGCPVSKLLRAPVTMNALLQPEAVHSA